MSSYVVTEQDKAEFERDIKPQRIGNANEFFREVQKVIRKKKWGVQDLRALNDKIEKGMGYALYQLFHVKAQHPLYLRYYPKIYSQPDSELAKMAELIDFFNDSSISSVEKEARLAEMEAKLVPATTDVKAKKVYDRVHKH